MRKKFIGYPFLKIIYRNTLKHDIDQWFYSKKTYFLNNYLIAKMSTSHAHKEYLFLYTTK